MDGLTYNYITGTNKLDYIYDTVGTGIYDNDIDEQPLHNYEYDAIGNMTKDSLAGIYKGGIEWTVYGKIKKIVKTNPDLSQTTIIYDYDPSGNRISKKVDTKVTRYVRDASGNVMSVYVYDDPTVNNGKLSQTETHLYGSSRLGINTTVTDVENSLDLPVAGIGSLESTSNITFVRGKKSFELGNHLGNVLATVSDVKRARSEDGSTVDHYDADLVSAQDYYPFGMLQPGRSWNIGNYRYGFNGKENDNEVKGDGNSLDFGARIYDPRIARFLSGDPLESRFPWQSTYVYAADNPVRFIDVDGKGPGDNIKLYTNTNSADFIAKGGFNATTFGKYSRYNWFSIVQNQQGTGRANTGVTLTVEGIDVSKRNVITEQQTTAWEAEALKEAGYTDESFAELKGKQRSAIRSEVLGRMYSKVGQYMNENAKDIYYLERDQTYAVSDNYLNFYGKVTNVSGPNASELIRSFSRQPLSEESAAALRNFGRATETIRWGGRAALAIMVAKDVYEIYESNYSTRVINNKIGAWGAAIPAATYGAEFGSAAGPVGAVIGGVLFGGAGYIIGETTTNIIQEYIFSKGVKY